MDKNYNKKDKPVNRKIPNSFEAEQNLLGAVMADTDIANNVVAVLKSSDFYYPSHQLIFAAMQKLLSANIPIDFVAVSDILEKQDKLIEVGGIGYITDISIINPSGANYKHYLEIVTRDSKLRELIGSANRILDNCSTNDNMQDAINFAEKEVFNVTYSVEQKDLVPINDGLLQSISNIEAIMTNQNSLYGLKTGFDNLDRIIRGYQPGQMIVLAARPGCGKTSFAMNIVSNIALSHPEKVIAVFNLEMSTEELSKRLLLSVAGVPNDDLYNKSTTELVGKIWAANEKLAKSKIYVDDTTGTTPEMIMGKCRRLKQLQKRLDFVVIDYLQLLKGSIARVSYQNEVADISRAIKIMAKELKVPVMVLSQTSRDLERRDDKTPKLSDLRDSGAIEQDADQVYFLTKDETPEANDMQIVDLNILKHRSGGLGKLKLKWQGNIVKFTSLDYQEFARLKAEHKGNSSGDSVDKASDDNDSSPPSDFSMAEPLERTEQFTIESVVKESFDNNKVDKASETEGSDINSKDRQNTQSQSIKSISSADKPKAKSSKTKGKDTPTSDGITEKDDIDMIKIMGMSGKTVKDIDDDSREF